MKWMAPLTAAVLALSVATAHAQNNPAPLAPDDGTNVVSIDAHNQIVAHKADGEYSLFVPKHIYSGAFARVLGGSIVTTEQMVIPESALRSGMGVNQGFNQPGSFGPSSNFTNGPSGGPGNSPFGGNNNFGNFGFNNRSGSGNSNGNFGFSGFGSFPSFNPGFSSFSPFNQGIGAASAAGNSRVLY